MFNSYRQHMLDYIYIIIKNRDAHLMLNQTHGRNTYIILISQTTAKDANYNMALMLYN